MRELLPLSFERNENVNGKIECNQTESYRNEIRKNINNEFIFIKELFRESCENVKNEFLKMNHLKTSKKFDSFDSSLPLKRMNKHHKFKTSSSA